jgi:hypothetical protein
MKRAAAKAEEEASSLRRRLAGVERESARAREVADAARKRAATAQREAKKALEKLAKLRGSGRR